MRTRAKSGESRRWLWVRLVYHRMDGTFDATGNPVSNQPAYQQRTSRTQSTWKPRNGLISTLTASVPECRAVQSATGLSIIGTSPPSCNYCLQVGSGLDIGWDGWMEFDRYSLAAKVLI